MPRKQQHCLFVEEEVYNWSSPRSLYNHPMLVMSVVILVTALLFGMLR
jgi:hypothetical protein